MNDCITTTKHSTTKPCAYFLGYTVGVDEAIWKYGTFTMIIRDSQTMLFIYPFPVCFAHVYIFLWYAQLLNSSLPLDICPSIHLVIIFKKTWFDEACVWSWIDISIVFHLRSQLGCRDTVTTWMGSWHSSNLYYSVVCCLGNRGFLHINA